MKTAKDANAATAHMIMAMPYAASSEVVYAIRAMVTE